MKFLDFDPETEEGSDFELPNSEQESDDTKKKKSPERKIAPEKKDVKANAEMGGEASAEKIEGKDFQYKFEEAKAMYIAALLRGISLAKDATLNPLLGKEETRNLTNKVVEAQTEALEYYRSTSIYKTMLQIFETTNSTAEGVAWETIGVGRDIKEVNGIYTHQDIETTAVLNALSGKEELPLKYQTELFRQKLIKEYNLRKSKDVKGYDATGEMFNSIKNSDARDLTRFAKEKFEWNYDPIGPHSNDEELLSEYYSYYGVNPTLNKYDETLYKALWKINKENGAPRIRLYINPNVDGAVGRSHYQSWENAMYLDLGNTPNLRDLYLSETSHAKQYAKSTPEQFAAWDKKRDEVFRLQRKWGTPEDKIYDTGMYATPGTLEYDAHRIIEPTLRSELIEKRYLEIGKLPEYSENERSFKREIKQEMESYLKVYREAKKRLDAKEIDGAKFDEILNKVLEDKAQLEGYLRHIYKQPEKNGFFY